jgi:hypothetical protein
VRLDFQGLAVWLGLPACRVLPPVLRPQPLEGPLERRASPIVCPHGGTGGAHGQASRPRGLRDLPLRERPVMLGLPRRRLACPEGRQRPWATRATCGERTPGTPRLSPQGRAACLRGGPGHALARRSGLAARPGLRWPCARRRGGRPRQLGRALGSEAEARRQGPRDQTLLVDWDRGPPRAPCTGRQAEEGIAGCTSRPPAARALVQVVVLAMAKTFLSALQARCGAHGPVSERFQGVHQAVRALDAVVRAGPQQLAPEDATALKQRRNRWVQSADHRPGDEWSARDEGRRRFPPLRATRDWGQDWRRWCERH